MAINSGRRTWKTIFLTAGIVFSFYIVLSVVKESTGRRSIFAVDVGLQEAGGVFDQLGLMLGGGSKLRLSDFHRIEVRGGRPVWEVKAKEAKYYSAEAVTHVSDAEVVIYRDGQSSVSIRASRARLYIEQEQLKKAELEGKVQLEFDQSLKMKTDLAVYDAELRKINAPGFVVIDGSGYSLAGVGMDVGVDQQVVKVYEQVSSSFEQKAKIPGDIPLQARPENKRL